MDRNQGRMINETLLYIQIRPCDNWNLQKDGAQKLTKTDEHNTYFIVSDDFDDKVEYLLKVSHLNLSRENGSRENVPLDKITYSRIGVNREK